MNRPKTPLFRPKQAEKIYEIFKYIQKICNLNDESIFKVRLKLLHTQKDLLNKSYSLLLVCPIINNYKAKFRKSNVIRTYAKKLAAGMAPERHVPTRRGKEANGALPCELCVSPVC